MSLSIIKGDCLPTITMEECQTENDLKGKWIELDETSLIDMFSSVIVQNQASEELGSEFAFHRVKDEEFYQEKFPGFEDKVYTILADEQKRLDKEALESLKH